MIKAKVSANYKDIERIFAGGSIQKEILKVWSTEADAYVFESWRVLEMEGPLPLTFKANGDPLIDYRIYGSTEQTGTPTPDNPIIPVGCGVRTENLIRYTNTTSTTGGGAVIIQTAGKSEIIIASRSATYADSSVAVDVLAELSAGIYTLSCEGMINHGARNLDRIFIRDEDGNIIVNDVQTGVPRQFTISEDTKITKLTLIFAAVSEYINQVVRVMLNTGSTPLHYEPYGYKLPILSNSTVTNIYLGEAETTRRIKKLVLTGEEGWTNQFGVSLFGALGLLNTHPFANINMSYSSHYVYNPIKTGFNDGLKNGEFGMQRGVNYNLFFKDTNYSDTSGWKSYLAAQYAAGTPVTVWYVLAEPGTGVVNEPLMKIGDYADIVSMEQADVSVPTNKGTTVIDYDREDHFITSDGYELVDKNQNGFLLSGSTLRPSKMYIKYKGR